MNCDKKDLLLYAVTDRHWLDGRRLIDVVRESLDGGVTMVQLRENSSKKRRNCRRFAANAACRSL